MKNPHILVIGFGSVGKRHARNLSALGCRISCVDPRADRREELAKEGRPEGSYPTVAAAFSKGAFDGVVVASPTASHPADTFSALERGIPVLLEKPVAKTAEEGREILKAEAQWGGRVLLGYTWRWWPPLERVRERLCAGEIGRTRHVQFYMSAHLADWHPWEPYQDFFMSSAAHGGGALLDESHWIDLMVWLYGMPTELSGRVEKISDLEIDADDTVDVHIAYTDQLRASLHLDLYGRPHEKYIRFIGEKGTLYWSAEPNKISLGRNSDQEWEDEIFSFERNHMFFRLAEEFLEIVAGRSAPSCTLADGLNVMSLIEAIRTSNRLKEVVRTGRGQ